MLKAFQDNLIAIYSFISEKKFYKAEIELLKLIQTIIATKSYRSSEIMQFVQSLYTDFNANYFRWLAKSGARIRVQLCDLYTNRHNNFLIGNCYDPSAMDTLLYKLLQCIKERDEVDIDKCLRSYITRLKNCGIVCTY